MRRVVWTEPALRDLVSIRDYIGEFNPLAAMRMLLRLKNAGDSLTEFPDRGRAYHRRWRELTLIRPYVIRYRVTEDVVFILRIRHGARQPV